MTTTEHDHSRDRRNVIVLAVAQAFYVTSQSMLIILSGLVGAELAANKALATLPISTIVIASTLVTIPASLLMKRIGRRAGFMLGTLFGVIGGAVASFAIYQENFWLFSFGTFIIGVYGGFALYYRFAAADVAHADFRSRAISLVMAGGVVAAFAGPELVKLTHDMMQDVAFVGSYITVIGLAILSMGLLSRVNIPQLKLEDRQRGGRPLGELARQPALIVAVISGMIGYGVMSLVMTATPLSMIGCGFIIDDASFVIQWHIVAMYGPAFFTGDLCRRLGVLKVILTGGILLAASAGVSLAGISIEHFWVSLVLLGLGWNFTFIGGSILLTETYEETERAKVQALNNFLVFGTVAVASLFSGTILHYLDWNAVNIAAIGPVGIVIVAVLWLANHRRRQGA
ncbi:MAG: MFS transporter [Rhodospirillaceae bacterium]|nr:MFS transporter [Rhodospirillaceae bacterium]